MECDSIEALNRAVEIGLGIAVLPERTIANRALAALRLEDEHFSPLGVIYRRRKALTPAMKRFIGLLKEPI